MPQTIDGILEDLRLLRGAVLNGKQVPADVQARLEAFGYDAAAIERRFLDAHRGGDR
jgi:hypothetical protein